MRKKHQEHKSGREGGRGRDVNIARGEKCAAALGGEEVTLPPPPPAFFLFLFFLHSAV